MGFLYITPPNYSFYLYYTAQLRIAFILHRPIEDSLYITPPNCGLPLYYTPTSSIWNKQKVTIRSFLNILKEEYISWVGVMSFHTSNAGLLFFILVYLLLFYDSSALLILRGINPEKAGYKKDCGALFFILVFMLLFIEPQGRVQLCDDIRQAH
jgi:hypothetical protein